MKNTQGLTNVLLAIGLVIVIGTTATWLTTRGPKTDQSQNTTATPAQPTTANSIATTDTDVTGGDYTATLDAVSLTSTSGNPTLIGTAKGVEQINIRISTYDSKTRKEIPVWGSSGIDAPVKNGKWSLRVAATSSTWSLTPGQYQVIVDGSPRSDPHADPKTGSYQPLAKGILIIH